MASDFLLAIGVLLATYSQLRFSAIGPVGPGELCILAWVGWALVTSPLWASAKLSPAFRRLASFWLVFAASLAIGAMTSYVLGTRNSPEHALHDLTAYTLMAAIGLLMLSAPDPEMRIRRLEWTLVVLGSAMLAAQLGQAYGLLPTLGLEFWFFDRLTGWTTNANQLALQCLVLTFVSLHLATTANTPRRLLSAVLCAILPLVCGYLSQSDSFILSLLLGAFGFIVLSFWHAAAQYVRSHARRALTLAIAVPVLLGSVASVIFVANHSSIELPAGTSESEKRLERDMGYRTELWSLAADRIIESGFLGLGPGPQLVRPADLREPTLDVLPDFEAHNTLIDLMLQGGVLAAGAFVWLMGSTALRLLRQGSLSYFLLIASLGVFSMTHFIIRHPIFWTAVMLSLATATARNEARPSSSRPTHSETMPRGGVPLFE